MKTTHPRTNAIAAASILFLLFLNASVLTFAARQPLVGGSSSSSSSSSSSTSSSSTSSSSTSSKTTSSTTSSTVSSTASETTPKDTEGDNQTTVGKQVENDTEGLQEDQNLQGTNELHFSLGPVNNSVPGHGQAGLEFEDGHVKVHAEIEGARNNTNYSLVLSVNGTKHPIGNLVTDEEGSGEIETEYALSGLGTYSFGISLNVGSNPDLVGSPSTQTAHIGASSSSEDSKDNNGDTQSQGGNGGDFVSLIQLDEPGTQLLNAARTSNQIPGIVNFDGPDSIISVSDRRFSVSAGSFGRDGLSLKVGAVGVTGPRVFMIELSNTFDLAHQLLVTLDGSRVSTVQSVSQLLSTAGQPAYLVASTPTGPILLFSVPHFSFHTLHILPILGQGFQLSTFVLLASMLAIGSAVAVAYRKRQVYSLPA